MDENEDHSWADGGGGGVSDDGGGSAVDALQRGGAKLTSELLKSSAEGCQHSGIHGNKDNQLMLSAKDAKNQDLGPFGTLLCRLQLEDKYQQKWTHADFMKILPPVSQSNETCEEDVAGSFIQRLMLLDYRARYIRVRQGSAGGNQPDSVPEPGHDEDSDLDLLCDTDEDSDETDALDVHPMDVQMAVFHCSDNFLKQTVITKLSQCQFAVPLLVPDPVTKNIECPLWTYRQIKKTWKTPRSGDGSGGISMKSMPICQAETPLVSVFRLGSLPLSKSQLMNTLINDRHSTFFHSESPGSTKSRHLMEGVAEIAWYCPAGKPNDAFTDCTAFCNLHGDAMLLKQQREILVAKASLIVVLVLTLQKGNPSSSVISELMKSPKPVIFLIADEKCKAVQKKPGKYKMGLTGKNQAAISEELQLIICSILSKPHDAFKLESMAEVRGITVDEKEETCQEAKRAAVGIQQLLQGMDVAEIKSKFLSCQGELWHQWCSTNKKQYHLKGSNIEKERSEKQEEMEKIREAQCRASGSELMTKFIKSLSLFQSQDREYFLKWTQILIDALPKNDLTPILQRYDKKWTEILTLKEKKQNSEEQEKELEGFSKQLQSATFGLEHIFREMGQIYEAHASLEDPPETAVKNWTKYPQLAAELLISGHPVELMDGDAAHVPQRWISSLLREVVKKLGDVKVFVLSVLGVQSSGKSTMLNAMFGLEFAVSAGRCTKGAFMQLLKVSEEMRHFNFDYLLVVDTEGLRALELAGSSTLKHDNELATFVVGLGDMTLINIFGENPSDMQDVLQIVVQAFMRMKNIKLSPGCVFVHQNVTDISAAEKNMDGKRRLQEKLDQMVQLAAKEEVSGAERFSDIIAFNVQEDVKYFAQLWEGSPPMAPPNPGYSESIQELKNFILSKASQSDGLKLSHFSSKVQDLWQALLNESFVFSFKNTLEIAVYRKLEVKYGDLTWELRSNMLTIENQYYNKIKNGILESVAVNDLYQETNETFTKIQTDLASYFEDDADKEILAQWRGRFMKRIGDVYADQVQVVKDKLDKVIQQKKACEKLEEEKTDFENKLMEKSRQLAQQFNGNDDDETTLQTQFNSEWSHWVQELTKGTKPIEEINLMHDRTVVLMELGIEWTLIDESNHCGNFRKMAVVGNYSHYVCTPENRTIIQKGTDFIKKQFMDPLSFKDQERIRSFINEVEQMSLITLKSKPVSTTGYNPTYLQELAKNAIKAFAEFASKQKYALKKEFVIDLLHYVFARAERWLFNEHKIFKANNDAQAYIADKKSHYYHIFIMCCKGSSSVMVFATAICDKLKTSIAEAICNNAAKSLANEIKSSCPAFSGNRQNLENHVLKSLAENENFDSFISYIQQPRKSVENFIREEVRKYILQNNQGKAVQILKRNIEELEHSVNQTVFGATEKVKTQRGNVDMWLEEFSSLLKDKMVFTMSSQTFGDITDFDFLHQEITCEITSTIEELHHLPMDEIMNSRMKPDEILIDQLCSCCWVTCPFCSAVCTNTLGDHSPEDHSVTFHRSCAVSGSHYFRTDVMDIEFCTTWVASDWYFHLGSDPNKTFRYKLYRTAGPQFANWRITPDGSKLPYWKWFVSRFEKDLEKYYGKKFYQKGEIPHEWRKYTKEQAIASLW